GGLLRFRRPAHRPRRAKRGGPPMKTIIAGSRTLTAYPLLCWAVESSRFDITEVFTGCARGIDQLAIRWAWEHRVPYRLFPADWLKWGTPAGPMRNIQMANHADAVIA